MSAGVGAFVLPVSLGHGGLRSSTTNHGLSRARQLRPAARASVRPSVLMGLKAVEGYNGAFDLSTDVRDALVNRLTSEDFVQKVAKQAECESVSFTGDLFQPVPYSIATPRGMPRDLEVYATDPQFMVVNIPPVDMFQARCFKPSRLSAVYRRHGVSEEVMAKLQADLDAQERKRQAAVNGAEEDPWADLGSAIREVFDEKPLTPEEEKELDGMVV